MSTDATFTPRSLTSSEYLRELFEPTDNVAILVRNRGTGKTVQRIAKAEMVASPEFQQWLAMHNAAGADVFVGMNPIKDEAFSRTKDNIKDIRHVYLDLDRNGDASLAAIRNSTDVPAPNFVLDTSPGKHQVVWKVNGFHQDEAESLLHSLANQFDGDLAATDSTRVLRLPGFANHKLSEEFIVQARQESDAIHTSRDFTVQDGSPEAPRHFGEAQQGRPTVPSNHKSQSVRETRTRPRRRSRSRHPAHRRLSRGRQNRSELLRSPDRDEGPGRTGRSGLWPSASRPICGTTQSGAWILASQNCVSQRIESTIENGTQ
jgi:hypothetical protein